MATTVTPPTHQPSPPPSPKATDTTVTASPPQNGNSSISSAHPQEQGSYFSCIAEFLMTLWNFITQFFCGSVDTPYTITTTCGTHPVSFFKPEERALLEKLFTKKNVESLEARAQTLTIEGETCKITHQVVGAIHSFEVESLPGLIFRFSPSNNALISTKFEYMLQAEEILDDEGLDLLIVPEHVSIKINNGEKELLLIAEKKYSTPSNFREYQLIYEKNDYNLYRIALQLTTFICKAKFGNISWYTIPLIVLPNGALRVVLDQLFPHANCGVKEGLLGSSDSLNNQTNLIGLISMVPGQAIVIQGQAQQMLSPVEFNAIRDDLDRAVEKAIKIDQRCTQIRKFHSLENITKDSPAIPQTLIEKLKKSVATADRAACQEICDGINGKIAAQVRMHTSLVIGSDQVAYTNLVHARELKIAGRLTPEGGDEPLNALLHKTILPALWKAEVFHSALTRDEAVNLNIGLRINLDDESSCIVQF